MTPPTPERDFGPPPMQEPTLGEVFWPGYAARRGLAIAYSEIDNITRDAVEDGCQAVAAHVAGDPPGPDPMHMMTIEMGAWCGASGPGNGRASSQWREVTCTACTAKGMTELRTLAWDLLATMGPSREALAFALRAGRLGVTDENGRPLVAACAHGEDPWLDAKLAGAEVTPQTLEPTHGPYDGLGPYGIAITALERILELDDHEVSWDDARAIASEAHGLTFTADGENGTAKLNVGEAQCKSFLGQDYPPDGSSSA